MPRDESSLKLVFPPACEAPIVKCVKAGKQEPGSFAAQKTSALRQSNQHCYSWGLVVSLSAEIFQQAVKHRYGAFLKRKE